VTKPLRGRKLKRGSRAAEFRQRLFIWKQTPESLRPSLRELARNLGTSHQLLGFYLQRWEEWGKAEEIRECATNRGIPRSWSRTYKRNIETALSRTLEQLEQDAKGGRLTRTEIEALWLFSSRGYRRAQDILRENRKSNLARATVSSG